VRDRVDDLQFHQPLGQQPQQPAGVAVGGLRAGQGGQPRLLLAVELGRHRGRDAGLAFQERQRASFDGLLAPRLQAARRETVCLGDALVSPGRTVGPLVGVEQGLRPLHLPPGDPPLADEAVQFRTLLGRQLQHVLLCQDDPP
jgi:hypothetical protein